MGSVDPTTLRDLVITVVVIGAFILGLIRTIYSARAKPPTGESLAALGAKMDAIEKDLAETKHRQTRFEEKMTAQNGDIWQSIDRLIAAVSSNGGKMDLFIDEMRNWRNNHHA